MSQTRDIPPALRILTVVWIWSSIFALRILWGELEPMLAALLGVAAAFGTHHLVAAGRRNRTEVNAAELMTVKEGDSWIAAGRRNRAEANAAEPTTMEEWDSRIAAGRRDRPEANVARVRGEDLCNRSLQKTPGRSAGQGFRILETAPIEQIV